MKKRSLSFKTTEEQKAWIYRQAQLAKMPVGQWIARELRDLRKNFEAKRKEFGLEVEQ